MAQQSAFRWTLLPEKLDYQPDEQGGDNIILPRVNTHIKLEARFASGADQQVPVITYRNDKLQCPTTYPNKPAPVSFHSHQPGTECER